MHTEIIKVDDTKGSYMFCTGTIKSQNKSTSSLTIRRILCVAIKKVIQIYELNNLFKSKYKRLRDIELPMNCQSMKIINNQLCVGLQSEFTLYSLVQEAAPIALLQTDHDKSLEFLTREPVNALMSIYVGNDEYLLIFENLGIYVNNNGCRSRNDEIMWPSKPLNVTYMDPYLLCFSERGIDVFDTKTGDWIQILQFLKTRPLDLNGSLCISHESQDSIRLIHLKSFEEEERITVATRSRSLMRSKLRKGSLNKADEQSLSILMSSGSSSANSFSTTNPNTSVLIANQVKDLNSSSRKSIISNPSNFQHLQHMGPHDGKIFMHDTHQQVNQQPVPPPPPPPLSLNSHKSASTLNNHDKKANINAKALKNKEISAPTNFRHVFKMDLNDIGQKSLVKDHLQTKGDLTAKSASTGNSRTSSQSSRSADIKANSTLYNGKLK
jgi:serine/threonine-protein kinase MRCK